jgi:hypothetical protein
MDTNVGDEGLRQLGRMTQVRTLYLGGSKVTDGGMAYLEGWTRLEDPGVLNTRQTGPTHARYGKRAGLVNEQKA